MALQCNILVVLVVLVVFYKKKFSPPFCQMTVELASASVFLVAAASMALPAVSRDFHTVLGAFLVLETCVGAFYSCSGLMRSR